MDLSQDLPQNVCVACFKIIRISYNFVSQYKKNQKTLEYKRAQRMKVDSQSKRSNVEYPIVNTTQLNSVNQQGVFTTGKLQFIFTQQPSTENVQDNETIVHETLDIKSEENIEEEEEVTISEVTEELQDIPDLVEISHLEESQIKTDLNSNDNETNLTFQKHVIANDHTYPNISQSELINITDHPKPSTPKFPNTLPNSLSTNPKPMTFIPIITNGTAVLIAPLIPVPSNGVSSGTTNNVQVIPVGTNKMQLTPLNSSNQTVPQIPKSKKIVNIKRIKRRLAVKKMKTSTKRTENKPAEPSKTKEPVQENQRKITKRIIKYICPICPDVVFLNHEGKFVAHLLNEHIDKTMNCNRCPLGDLDCKSFIDHYIEKHSTECFHCKKVYKDRTHLLGHLKIHERVRHHCTQADCKKSFVTKFALRKHLETHSGNVEYTCQKCAHISTTYDTHKYHERMHAGRRYLCPHCGQTFLQAGHLNQHMWKHTGEKKFQCDHCGNKYSCVMSLKKHKRKFHSTNS